MELFGESPEEESNDDKKEESTEDNLIVSDSEYVSLKSSNQSRIVLGNNGPYSRSSRIRLSNGRRTNHI